LVATRRVAAVYSKGQIQANFPTGCEGSSTTVRKVAKSK
jgi:hypothetical protein